MKNTFWDSVENKRHRGKKQNARLILEKYFKFRFCFLASILLIQSEWDAYQIKAINMTILRYIITLSCTYTSRVIAVERLHVGNFCLELFSRKYLLKIFEYKNQWVIIGFLRIWEFDMHHVTGTNGSNSRGQNVNHLGLEVSKCLFGVGKTF